ncbi:hypothetical protein SOVF_107060 [Spinacia oleracea]|nr:hypothetical protein SOVF_107060 [Spinacia oleracea]
MQSIPKAFLEKELKGYKPIESVVLTTDYQPHRHWLVKVEGGRAFKEGWNEFCSHYGLKAGDFLVFAHQLNLMFQVSVFDPLTACHRSFSSSNHIIGSNTKRRGSKKLRSSYEISGKRRSSKANPSVKDQQLSCRITLSFYAFTSTNVYLPKWFVRESGLENRCCVIKLIGGEGKAWEVKLRYRKYDSQAFIKGGWKEFQAANSLRPRDIICFQLLERGRWPIMNCYRK